MCMRSLSCFFIAVFFFIYNLQAQHRFSSLGIALDSMHQTAAYHDASISFTLIDPSTGELLFEKNKDLPLAPASTLKTFTTASALHILGSAFQFQTKVTFKGRIINHVAFGELRVHGCGDPSLGSDRYATTKPELVFKQISKALKQAGISSLKGKIVIVDSLFDDEAMNAGWLDEDIGNYYGAGIHAFNWKENKFSLGLRYTDNSFTVSSNNAGYDNASDFCTELNTQPGATTESAFAYLTPDSSCAYTIRGFLAPADSEQTIQLARVHPADDFCKELAGYLHVQALDTVVRGKEIDLCRIRSPRLDSLVYYCNQKSLNLYAEALCKTLSARLYHHGNWEQGLHAMKHYAASRHIDTASMALLDASGLAPGNRITTFALASLLKAYTREPWYNAFYNSLPLINGLHMKSGYIGGTRSYAGYITLPDGRKACFAFIIHGYTCPPARVKADMFALLDRLKPLP